MAASRQADVRTRARAVGRKRDRASILHDEALDELVALVPDARAYEVELTEVAKLAGMSKPSLYELLKRRTAQ